MFIFGMPSILLILANSVPVIVKYLRGYEVSDLAISVSSLQILVALYIVGVLAESYKQICAPQEPEVRSITIH